MPVPVGAAYLVADLRERQVIPHLAPLLGDCLVTHQIHTGDYLICVNHPEGPQVVACIERKSLKDFASSFKDGRYENRKKMLEYRDRTGCQLYYLVEGPAFPNPDWVVGSGVKYQSILSAITTLPLASGIHILHTRDTQHSALRMRDFVKALGRIPDPYLYPVVAEPPGEAATARAAGGGTGALVPLDVTGTYEKDPDTLCMDLWNKLPGISLTTAKILVERCSITDFLYRGDAVLHIAAFKLATGKILVNKGRQSLAALRGGDALMAIKVLSGVTGITVTVAKEILTSMGRPTHQLHVLCGLQPAALAETMLAQKSRKIRLGLPKAKRILKMLRWNSGMGVPPAAAAGAAAAATTATMAATAAPMSVPAPEAAAAAAVARAAAARGATVPVVPVVPPSAVPVVPVPAAPVVPMSAAPVVPMSAAPVVPMSAAPVVPTTAAPVVPTTAAPVVPTTAAPVVPTTAAPVVPTTAAPVVPTTAAPAAPEVMSPADCAAADAAFSDMFG